MLSKDQSAVSVPVSIRLLPLTNFLHYPAVCSSRSIVADGRATVFSYFKTNHTKEPTPQPETLVIRYGIVNGSFIVRERENYSPLPPKATRFAILFQTTRCVRLLGASSSDSFEIIAPEVRHRNGTLCALGNP